MSLILFIYLIVTQSFANTRATRVSIMAGVAMTRCKGGDGGGHPYTFAELVNRIV